MFFYVFSLKKILSLQPLNQQEGVIAQLVEHRTENPCVPGSNPGDPTLTQQILYLLGFFCTYKFYKISNIGKLPIRFKQMILCLSIALNLLLQTGIR